MLITLATPSNIYLSYHNGSETAFIFGMNLSLYVRQIAAYVYAHGLAGLQPEPLDKYEFIRTQMYSTDYESLLPSTYSWPEHIMKPQGKGCV